MHHTPAADCLATVDVSGSVTTIFGDLGDAAVAPLVLLGDTLDDMDGDDCICFVVVVCCLLLVAVVLGRFILA